MRISKVIIQSNVKQAGILEAIQAFITGKNSISFTEVDKILVCKTKPVGNP